MVDEFKFCHPDTQFHLNEIYNSSFYGSAIWDLFCRESEMLENTWNTSFRIMYNLPYATHRYFVQSVSTKMHIKNILLRRFLGFLNQIVRSQKKLPKLLLKTIKNDSRSTTGSNLRKLMLLLGKHTLEDIKVKDIDKVEYSVVEPANQWKVEMVKDLIVVRATRLHVDNFANYEFDEILEYLCTS